MKEFDNVAVFPHETSGRFNRSAIDPTAVYEVSGEEAKPSEGASQCGDSPSRFVKYLLFSN